MTRGIKMYVVTFPRFRLLSINVDFIFYKDIIMFRVGVALLAVGGGNHYNQPPKWLLRPIAKSETRNFFLNKFYPKVTTRGLFRVQ